MHIYHYAAYEKTALRKLSVLHVAGEDAVDELLREGVLVDLYPTVRNSIRISEKSYSIKKLEPLYMGPNLRSGDVKDAGASVVAYAHYCDARDNGRAEEAERILAGISRLQRVRLPVHAAAPRLALGLAQDRGIKPGGDRAGPRHVPATVRGRRRGRRGLGRAPLTWTRWKWRWPTCVPAPGCPRTTAGGRDAGGGRQLSPPGAQAVLVGALRPLREGPDTQHQQDRDVFRVEAAEVLQDWWKDGTKLPERRLRLIGTVSPGSDLREGSTWFRMYEPPLPAGLEGTGNNGTGRNGWFGTEVLELGHEDGKDTVSSWTSCQGVEPTPGFPMA